MTVGGYSSARPITLLRYKTTIRPVMEPRSTCNGVPPKGGNLVIVGNRLHDRNALCKRLVRPEP